MFFYLLFGVDVRGKKRVGRKKSLMMLLITPKVVSSVIWLALVQAIIAPLALLFFEVLDQVSGAINPKISGSFVAGHSWFLCGWCNFGHNVGKIRW